MTRTNEFPPEALDALIRYETELSTRAPRETVEPSSALEKRILAIEPKQTIRRLPKRVVRLLVAAAAILVLTVSAAASPAVRQFVLRVFSDHTQLVTPAVDEKLEDLVCDIVPAGFAETQRQQTADAIVVRYESGDDWFTLTKSLSGGWFGFDTEETEAREFDVDGVRHIAYASDENTRGVIRYDGGFIYAVSGSLDEAALTQIVDGAR